MATVARLLPQLTWNVQMIGKRLFATKLAAKPADSMPMSKYIGREFEIKAYNNAQDHHAGRLQARREIIELLKSTNAQNIVEMGTGPGNSLQDMLIRLPNSRFIGLDCDKHYLAEAHLILEPFLIEDNEQKPRLQLIEDYIQTWIPTEKQDAFVALGAFTDLAQDPLIRIQFLKDHCIKHILKPGGHIYIEEEIFPMHTVTDKHSRALAAWRQRGSIILDALLQERTQEEVLILAQLELKALISSLHDIGDHKATLCSFLHELHSAGLTEIKWKKIWPLPNHRIAIQDPKILLVDSECDPNEKLRASQLWDYYSSIILKSCLSVDPQGHIDTEPNYLKAAVAINDCYSELQAIKEKTTNYGQFINTLTNYGLHFKPGQFMEQPNNDPIDDIDGGVFIFTAKTSQ